MVRTQRIKKEYNEKFNALIFIIADKLNILKYVTSKTNKNKHNLKKHRDKERSEENWETGNVLSSSGEQQERKR